MKVLCFVAILVAVAHTVLANNQVSQQNIGKELAKEKESNSDIQILGNLMLNEDRQHQQFILQPKVSLKQTDYECKNEKNFTKTPKPNYPVDIDYNSQDNSNRNSINMSRKISKNMSCKNRYYSESKLPNAVKDLVCLIFDMEGMKRTMIEFGIDLPIEKLSKDQIMKAYKVLTEVQTALSNKGAIDQLQINDALNRFYKIIPHNFSEHKPALLNEFVEAKTDMLNNLLEIEFTYSMLKENHSNSDRNLIDYYYSKLKTQIDVLDNNSNEFSVISQYIRNTHYKRFPRDNYKKQVVHIFKIARQGEEDCYKPFKQMPNRQLLWHGSRVTNFAGILSKGLRIAPPGVPITGSLFGNGIYFADMFTLSARFSGLKKHPNDSTLLLLLSEVALGDMYQLTTNKSITKLPKGKDSTKGLGLIHPDPNNFFMRPDGVKVPYGIGVPSNFELAQELYNVYVVYNETQHNLKYLVQVDVKF